PIPLDEDHLSICRPESRETLLYKRVRRFVQECLQNPSVTLPRTGRVPGVPEVPPWFVSRLEASRPLRRALVGRANGPTTAVISALHGLGGVGKTTLAAALVEDLARTGAFPDGTFWLTLGEEATEAKVLAGLADLVRFFGDREYPA